MISRKQKFISMLFILTGMIGLFFLFYHVIKFEHVANTEADYKIFMCGGSSDSGDKIGEMYINSKYKDELKEGTKIIVKDVGAYFEEFFMSYSSDLKIKYISKNSID